MYLAARRGAGPAGGPEGDPAGEGRRPPACARFLLEAEISGNLEHPGIVPVYGLGAHADGRPFYVMRFIQGDSLKEAIQPLPRRGPGPPARRAVARACGTCWAGSWTCARRSPTPTPAACCTATSSPRTSCSATTARPWWSTGGWPRRSAAGRAGRGPRRARGARDARAPLGGEPGRDDARRGAGDAAVHEPGAGRGPDRPPGAGDGHLRARRHALRDPRRPAAGGRIERGRDARPGPPRRDRPAAPGPPATCPAPWRPSASKALALRPEDRYPTAQSLADDVERWLADEPVSAWREPASTRLRRWARRHETLATAAGVAALFGLVTARGGLPARGEVRRGPGRSQLAARAGRPGVAALGGRGVPGGRFLLRGHHHVLMFRNNPDPDKLRLELLDRPSRRTAA